VFKKMIFVAALFMLSQANAYHYGMAGCGLGSLVFADQPGKIQIVSGILNNLVSPQTFAITSGTSGCYEDQSSSAKINYIEKNIVSLKADAARGQGETVDGLITLLKCKQADTVKGEFKNNFNEIFENQSAEQVLIKIQNNQVVKSSCGTIG